MFLEKEKINKRWIVYGNERRQIYNPSFIYIDGEKKGIARCEDKMINHLDQLFTQKCWPVNISTKEHKSMEVIDCREFCLKNDEFRTEDYRLYQAYGNNTYFSCCFIPYVKDIGNLKCKQAIGQVNWKTNQLYIQRVFDSPFNKPIEKNWGFFELNNELYFIYSVSPWLIYKVTYNNLEVAAYDNFNFNWCEGPGSYISVSTHPVSFNEKEMVLFAHSKETGTYHNTPVAFDKTTLLPVKCCSKPMFSGEKEKGNKERVLYISGMEIINDDVYVYAGERDLNSVEYQLTKKQIIEYLE